MPSGDSGGGARGTIIRIALQFLRRIRQRAQQGSQSGTSIRMDAPQTSSGTFNDIVKKFLDQVFSPNANNNGADQVFRSLGYGPEHAPQLAQQYTQQANQRYASHDYTLGQSDQRGQHMTIPIDLNGTGSAQGQMVRILTGWILGSNGSLNLHNPFAGLFN